MKIVAGRSAVVKLSIIVVFSSFVAILLLVGSRQRASASAFGPTPTHTNPPGEGNCTACHSDFQLNSGSGSVEITGVPSNYSPGQQVNVLVTATQADAVIYGFQLTAIDSTGQRVGTFEIPPQSQARVQILLGVVGGNLVREYVQHTSGGLSNGQFGFNSWVFTWTAPSVAAGRVDFYAAGNGANSDGNTGGDFVYTDTAFTIPAAAPFSISGRVFTPSGLALRNARVILTDSNSVQQSAVTSSFGNYSFSNVAGNANYTLSVVSKRYRFAPNQFTLTANLSNLDFTGLE